MLSDLAPLFGWRIIFSEFCAHNGCSCRPCSGFRITSTPQTAPLIAARGHALDALWLGVLVVGFESRRFSLYHIPPYSWRGTPVASPAHSSAPHRQSAVSGLRAQHTYHSPLSHLRTHTPPTKNAAAGGMCMCVCRRRAKRAKRLYATRPSFPSTESCRWVPSTPSPDTLTCRRPRPRARLAAGPRPLDIRARRLRR